MQFYLGQFTVGHCAENASIVCFRSNVNIEQSKRWQCRPLNINQKFNLDCSWIDESVEFTVYSVHKMCDSPQSTPSFDTIIRPAKPAQKNRRRECDLVQLIETMFPRGKYVFNSNAFDVTYFELFHLLRLRYPERQTIKSHIKQKVKLKLYFVSASNIYTQCVFVISYISRYNIDYILV